MSGERVDKTDGTAAAKADGDGEGDCDLDLGLCPMLPAPPLRSGVLAPLLAAEGDAVGGEDDDDEVESARPRLGLDLAR